MLIYPIEPNGIKKVYDTVVTYRKHNGPTTTVIHCDGERVLEVLLENNGVKLPLQILIDDQGMITTSVGICFSNVDTFMHDFNAIDWVSLADYNVKLNAF